MGFHSTSSDGFKSVKDYNGVSGYIEEVFPNRDPLQAVPVDDDLYLVHRGSGRAYRVVSHNLEKQRATAIEVRNPDRLRKILAEGMLE